ncbi:hypothetical protein Scep_010081 [Stephania cephalantha]|uniref:Uncharacterized protein n=1 Tax=Stephania cephalantha TaxID=152367 RepID=A0AAP0JWL7_9MAGN
MPWEPSLERLKGAMELPRPPQAPPFIGSLAKAPRRDKEARPIFLDSPLLLSPSAILRWDPSIDEGIVRAPTMQRRALALDKDEDDEVTPHDVFLHVHTKDHDGVTFIDSRSTQFHVTLYYDAAGVCPKGRVYGLGSLARKTRRYADPGASTSQEPMVWRLEFDAVVKRLAQV